MSNPLNGARNGLVKAVSTLTSITTIMSLSGFAALAPVATYAAVPSDYGLQEGNTISASGSDDPDVYIVNEHGYKRLFLNPVIFSFYGHLGGFAQVKSVTPTVRDAFPTSGLFRNCESNDQAVWAVEVNAEDNGALHWVNMSGSAAVAEDPNFFKKVFCINNNEANWYPKSSVNYTSLSQIPVYARVPGATPTPVAGPLSVALAPGNPAPATITLNAVGVEMLRVRFNGTGTINTINVKRQGAGQTDDFDNIFIYDGATRLTSGKSFSSSSGDTTFLLNVAVNGSKDLSIVADMASANTAGNVNYIQLVSATAAGGAAISGTPLNGNNFTSSGASSGTIDVAKVGSISDPTVGQKNAQVSEFKLTANTEGAIVKRLTMLQGGTVKPSDLSNIRIETGASSWTGSVTTDSYFVFDLGSGFTIAKGGNATFKVYADLGGKKDETIDLYFENNSDVLAIGDQYGQGMAEGTNTLDTAAEATTLTLQGGALTLAFNGPTASTVGTTASDVTLLRYSMTAVSNMEIKKTEFTLCADQAGDGTYDTETTEADWDDVTDFKVSNEATNSVVIGPKDATAFDHADDTSSCPAGGGVQESFTDTLDLLAGVTYNFKVTADINTANVADELVTGSIIRAVLDDYSDDAGDVTVAKYSGTNTAVAAADIVPRADISGPDITLSASSLTLSLAGSPASQTQIRGTQNVDAVGVTFAANQSSAVKVTTIKLTGVAIDTTGDTYDEGTPDADNDSGISVANMASSVELYESGGALIAGTAKVTNNSLGTGGTGTITFSNLDWNIPAGTSKTMLVRVDLSNNQASGSAGDLYAFDIAATTDVTALDNDSNTINPGNSAVNGGLSPTKVLTVKNSGSMTLATSANSPSKGAVYWGQTNAPISKFRLSATDESQFIEKLTFAASATGEATDAIANVKTVRITYKNKAGSTLTSEGAFGQGASVNFAWSSGDANRPYVPMGSNMEVSVNADLRTDPEGATQDSTSAVFFSLDLVDKFNGSVANGFRAVGEGSGTVIDGSGTNISDVLGANDQYVYKVFPQFASVALSSPYSLSGTPTVFKFSITAMGLSTSTLRFDNENAASGTIKFEILSSGNAGGDTSVTTFLDGTGEIVDTATLTNDGDSTTDASYTMDFSSKDIEIDGGQSKTFYIQLNSTSVYDESNANGEAGDYFQVVLRDASADDTNLVRWVGDYDGTTGSADTTSTAGVLKTLPLFGPNFTR